MLEEREQVDRAAALPEWDPALPREHNSSVFNPKLQTVYDKAYYAEVAHVRQRLAEAKHLQTLAAGRRRDLSAAELRTPPPAPPPSPPPPSPPPPSPPSPSPPPSPP